MYTVELVGASNVLYDTANILVTNHYAKTAMLNRM